MIFPNSWLWILLALTVLVLLKIIGTVLEKKKKQDFAYLKKDSLLTEAEKSFYAVLQNVVGGNYLLFSQVSLLEILSVPNGLSNSAYRSALNKIQSKHIDFLLCEKESTRPILVIELDDSSHFRPDRVGRDDFLKAAFAHAGLPFLQVARASHYDEMELKNRIRELLSDKSSMLR